jgi:hypothetical protein
VRVVHILRKPLAEESVARNVVTHGAGALNVGACRIRSGPQPKASVTPGTDSLNRRNAEQGFRPKAYESGPILYEPDPGGRWPANLVIEHRPGCRRAGTRRVPTGTAVNRNKDGSVRSELWGFAGRQGPDLTYGDGDGMETVEAWDCASDCPVPALDAYCPHIGGASRFFFQAHREDG